MADLSTKQDSVDDLTTPEATTPDEAASEEPPPAAATLDEAAPDEPPPAAATPDEAAPDEPPAAAATVEEATPQVALPTPEVATAAAATVEGVAPEVAAEPARPARRRLSRWAALVTGLSALLVALLVGAAFLIVHAQGISQRATQRPAVINVAKTVVTDLTTLGKEDAKQHVDRLLQQSTGVFRDQLVGSSQIFQDGLKAAGLESTGVVTAVGVETIGSDTATALVTVSTATVDDETPQGKLRNFHLAVGLQRDGDHWLASTVEYLP